MMSTVKIYKQFMASRLSIIFMGKKKKHLPKAMCICDGQEQGVPELLPFLLEIGIQKTRSFNFFVRI